MSQTILGVAVLVVGLAGIAFNDWLASSYLTLNRWAFSLETSFSSEAFALASFSSADR